MHVQTYELTCLRYVTDNPGAWFFHCHIQWHLLVDWTRIKFVKPEANLCASEQSGMALVLVEGESLLPNLLSASTEPSSPSVPRNTTTPGVSRPQRTATNGVDNLAVTKNGLLMVLLGVLFTYTRF